MNFLLDSSNSDKFCGELAFHKRIEEDLRPFPLGMGETLGAEWVIGNREAGIERITHSREFPHHKSRGMSLMFPFFK